MRRAALVLALAAARLPVFATGTPENVVVLAGEVLVAGAPAAGAGVELYRLSGAPSPVPLWSDDADWVHPEWDLESPIPPGPPLARAETDGAGRYAFPGLPPGRYAVLAATADGARGFGQVVLFRPGSRADLEIQVPGGGPHGITGVARFRDGRPFRGTIVFSRGRESAPMFWTLVEGLAIPDEEGKFAVPGLFHGLLEITVAEPGRFRAALGTVLVPREEPLELVVDERLMETRGIVLDPDGRPAADVLVLARGDGDTDGGWYDPAVAAGARTDAAGRFLMLGPLAPEFRVADPERWLPAVEERGKTADGVVLAVRPRPRVRGIVRRADDGTPLAGVPVIAAPSGATPEPGRVVLTDAAGRFDLAAPDPYFALSAWGRGWVPRDISDQALTVHLSAGEDRQVAFDMVPAARVSGLIEDPDGEPVPNVTVEVGIAESYAAGWILSSVMAPETDAAGRFSLDCLPIGVKAYLHGGARIYAQWGREITCQAENDVTIGLVAAGNRIHTGRLLVPPGATCRDVRISCGDDPVDLADDGRFTVFTENDEAQIVARGFIGDVFHRGRARLAPAGETEVAFEPASTERVWVVRVVAPAGRPVPAGECDFRGRNRICEGRFWFDAESLGWTGRTITGAIWSFRDERGRPLPYAPASTGPLPPGVTTITLGPGRVVVGEIATEEGQPVPGAWISAVQVLADPKEWGRTHARAQSDLGGRFELVGLGPGAYRLYVRAPLAYDAPAVTTLAPDVRVVKLVATEHVAARVTVLDPDGRPVRGARVTLVVPEKEGGPLTDGRVVETTDGAGVAAFPLLSPKLLAVLTVAPPGDGFLPYSDFGFRPADATVVLARAHALSGRVVDAAGKPVADAAVFLRAAAGAPPLPAGFSYERIEGGFVLAALTGPAGSFAVRRLPATTLEVMAVRVAADGTEARTPVATTPGGAAGLVLRLP